MKKLICVFLFLIAISHAHSSNLKWTTPSTVSTANINAIDAEIAIDGNGNSLAVWIANGFVKSKSKSVNGSWSNEVTVSGMGASSPRLVMDLNGNATAIWIENSVIKGASHPLNGGWSSSTILSSTGANSPVIAVDTAGDVLAVWVRNGNIESSAKLFGTNWHVHLTINSSSASSPKLAIGGTGANTIAYLVWEELAGGTNVVIASSKLVTSNWTTPQIISDTAQNAAKPSVAVDGNGNAVAVWFSYGMTGNSYNNVMVRSSSFSSLTGNWTTISTLSAPGLRNPGSLHTQVAFDSIGNAIAQWTISFDDETFNLETAVKPLNGTWSAPLDLITSNLYAFSSDLSVSPYGDALALYMFYNGESLLIQSVESNINGFANNSWSIPITISSGASNAFPKIAATLTGNVLHAAGIWVSSNGSTTSVFATTAAKTLLQAPSNLTVSQNVHNFGVFTEYYNTLSWHASLDPNTVGYLIFRNGEFIAQVGANTLQFVDDNRTQNGPVKYSVTAIDSQQTQSPNVSVNFP